MSRFEFLHRWSDFGDGDDPFDPRSGFSELENRDRQLEQFLATLSPGVPVYAGTSQRPKRPAVGQLGVDVTNRVLEVWDGSAWAIVADPAWGAARAWTPVVTGMVNATAIGRYRVANGVCRLWAQVVLGAGGSVSGAVTMSTPVPPAHVEDLASGATGSVELNIGGTNYVGDLGFASPTTYAVLCCPSSGGFLYRDNLTSSTPATWGPGSYFRVSSSYMVTA